MDREVAQTRYASALLPHFGLRLFQVLSSVHIPLHITQVDSGSTEQRQKSNVTLVSRPVLLTSLLSLRVPTPAELPKTTFDGQTQSTTLSSWALSTPCPFYLAK